VDQLGDPLLGAVTAAEREVVPVQQPDVRFFILPDFWGGRAVMRPAAPGDGPVLALLRGASTPTK
jgi:hypothetical protein